MNHMKKKFYNRMEVPIKQYIPNQFSNLDNDIKNILPINIMDDLDINKYMDNFSNYMINNKLNNEKFIEEGLIFLLNKKRKRNETPFLKIENEEIKNCLNDIIDKIIIKFNFKSIKFLGVYEFLDSINIPLPKKNHFFLAETNKKNYYFIIFNSEFDKNPYYEYNIASNSDILGNKKKKLEFIIQKDSYYISANLNKTEKFYAFKIYI